MNKKAQLGKIISYVPILILVISIMAIFIFIAFALSLKTGFKLDSPIITTNDNNLLLKTIEIEYDLGDDTTAIQRMLAYEAITKLISKEITEQELRSSLRNLVEETNKCFYLRDEKFSQIPTEGGGYEEIPGLFTPMYNGKIPERPNKRTIEVGDKTLTVFHYIGECP